MDAPTLPVTPSLSRDALSGRLQRAVEGLEGRSDPAAAWQRGWLRAAQGEYGDAIAELDDACARGDDAVRAAAALTRGAILRQLHLFEHAEAADLEGLELLDRSGVRCAWLRAGLRVSLLADAVGRGSESATLTRRLRVARAAVSSAGSWRQQVRYGWAVGEMARSADPPQLREAAKAFAASARRSRERGARRHEAKSLVFLAGARAAGGEAQAALTCAERGMRLAARCGAVPLLSVAELVLARVHPDAASREVHRLRARRLLDGLLATLPSDLRAAAAARVQDLAALPAAS